AGIPVEAALDEAGRRRRSRIDLAGEVLLQGDEELGAPRRRRERPRELEVLEGQGADPADLVRGDAEQGLVAEQVRQARQELLAAVAEAEDEPSMVQAGVLPLDVVERAAQHAADLRSRRERQLAEADG